MGFDVLILNSGEWVLAEQLPAEPWHILIYRQREEKRNELHLWLPRQGERSSGEFAFRRYWIEGRTRWCVEAPRSAASGRAAAAGVPKGSRLRFTAPDGMILWASNRSPRRLADLTNRELEALRSGAVPGAFSI